jgi:hypothetical protein
MEFLSAYLSKRYDYNRNEQIKSKKFSYIEKYYYSILKLKKPCKIFIDTEKNMFSRKKTKYIDFIFDPLTIINHNKPKFEDKILIHDLRFILFRNHIFSSLKTNKHKKFYFLSDISDVELLNDPTKLHKNYLYVGLENQNILDNEWFQIYMKEMEYIDYFKDYQKIFKNKIILNCGTIYGEHKLILKLLNKIVSLMYYIYKNYEVKRPLDMFLVNYCVYKYFNKYLYHTNNFSTIFGNQEYDKTKIVKHK